MPVLVDAATACPFKALHPWPAARLGEIFVPPVGRGVARMVSDSQTGRCPICRRAFVRRTDGAIVAHKSGQMRCAGSGQAPGDDVVLASWLPVIQGLTPHGLRHGHKTWMDEAGIADVLKAERLGASSHLARIATRASAAVTALISGHSRLNACRSIVDS